MTTANSQFAVSTVRCAGPNCEHIRREVNHWFIVWVDDSDKWFHCAPFSPDVFAEIGSAAKPVCGQQCAQKLFEEFLAKKVTREAEA